MRVVVPSERAIRTNRVDNSPATGEHVNEVAPSRADLPPGCRSGSQSWVVPLGEPEKLSSGQNSVNAFVIGKQKPEALAIQRHRDSPLLSHQDRALPVSESLRLRSFTQRVHIAQRVSLGLPVVDGIAIS